MKVKVLSCLAVFSLVFSSAQPYQKADLEKMEVTSEVIAAVPSLGHLIGTQNDRLDEIGLVSKEVAEFLSAALEKEATVLPAFIRVADKINDQKENLVDGWYNDDNSFKKTEVREAAIALGIALLDEGAHFGSAKLIAKFFGKDEQRYARRGLRVASDALIAGLFELVEKFVRYSVGPDKKAEVKDRFKESGKDSLKKLSYTAARTAIHEIVGEMIRVNAEDELVEQFDLRKFIASKIKKSKEAPVPAA